MLGAACSVGEGEGQLVVNPHQATGRQGRTGQGKRRAREAQRVDSAGCVWSGKLSKDDRFGDD